MDDALTVPLSLDELRVVEAAFGTVLPLRFDDAPDVWNSLLDPDGKGWLLRHQVQIPGLSGWLGLRLPFDETSGVLLHTSRQQVALSDLDRAVPVHGLLWLMGGTGAPAPYQLQLLRFARQNLYQQLVGLLAGGASVEEAEAASRYAMSFTHAAWVEGGGRLAGTAAHLVQLVSVHGSDGVVWGTMARWLAVAHEHRPVLPVRLRAFVTRFDEHRAVETGFLNQVEVRLSAAAHTVMDGVRTNIQTDYQHDGEVLASIDRRWSSGDTVTLVVNLSNPIAFQVSEGDAMAQELLLLELARLVASWSRQVGRPVALHEMQRVLVAQRIGVG